MSELLRIVKEFPGFKMSNSHYRIGSKLHISDFYYAKRMFQNSFFANRFAFLLAKAMINDFSPTQLNTFKERGLSLVGYGLYSELLLSLVEKFLKKGCGFKSEKISHNVAVDDAEIKFVKDENLLPYCVIIVTIASTFSTAIKIEELIGQKHNSIVSTFQYNILHISGNSSSESISKIEREFGWIEKNRQKKAIIVNAFFDSPENKRTQKYFISLPTFWSKIEDCRECFPLYLEEDLDHVDHSLLEEKALFETDRSTLVPTIIFDFPLGRVLDPQEQARTYFLNPGMLRYPQNPQHKSHFIYSINSENFLAKNLKKIRDWLFYIKGTKQFSDNFPNHSHTLVISSCHHYNASFLDLINDILFQSSANIIHYDPQNDFIQNFELTYGNDINAADKIIFIDDTLKSGDTFSKINNFVQYVLRNGTSNIDTEKSSKLGIHSCIFLINKSNTFTYQLIEEKLVGAKQIFSYSNLHLFASLSIGNKSALFAEQARYLELSQFSFLDSLKIHFAEQYLKLFKGKLEVKKASTHGSFQLLAKRERHLMMLAATNLIFQYFSSPTCHLNNATEFHEFLNTLNKNVNNPIIYSPVYNKGLPGYTPIEASVLKALTQYPFTQYAPLRRIVFKWVIELLDNEINTLQVRISNNTLSFDDFNKLKFLLRRACQMNSNYLISQKMFLAIKELVGNKGLCVLEANLQSQLDNDIAKYELFEGKESYGREILNYQIKQIKEFHVFFTAQIKELLVTNEIRALKLENLLLLSLGKGYPAFNQIVRILLVENTFVIQRFYDFLILSSKWKQLFFSAENEGPIIDKTTAISTLLSQDWIKRHQRYRTLEQFFSISNQAPPLSNTAFLNYLWIQYFIEFDSQKNYLSLTQKTDQIFLKLKQIIEFKNATNTPIANTGIFLVIRDTRNKAFLVYDKDSNEHAILDGSNWQNQEDKYLMDFLSGIHPHSLKYNKTIVELRRDIKGKKWIDTYSVFEKNEISDLSYSFLPEKINHIILLRLSKRVIGKPEKKLGMMGIYFKSDSNIVTDANRIRYLLLLRNSLGNFVEKHHQNNEFRDWVISENTKRLALLSGHGKEMLKNLYSKNKVFNDIALNLEHLQMIILLNENIKKHGDDDIRDKFNHFYDVHGSFEINQEYVNDLKKMADDIYEFEEIEEKVPCNVIIKPLDKSFKFSFNKNILNLICFELFVNAKKNRWHFMNGESIEGRTENTLQIEFRILEANTINKLELTISNIGPHFFDPDMINRLNHRNQNVKTNDITAGTSLLKILILKILEGDIHFDQYPICKKNSLSLFTVKVTLKEMNDN